MAVVRCVNCDRVYLPEELSGDQCPGCKNSLSRRAAGPPGGAGAAMGRGQRRVVLVVGLLAVAVLVLLILRPGHPNRRAGQIAGGAGDVPRSVPATQAVEGVAATTRAVAAADQEARNPVAGQLQVGQEAARGDGDKGGTGPVGVPVPIIEPPARPVAVVPAAAGAARAEDGVAAENTGSGGPEIRNLDRVGEDYEVEPLNGNAAVKLTGKVKRLKVNALGGAAILDASQLDAREIVVCGAINGSATLKLNSPKGSICLTGVIDGGTHVEINARDGVVAIGRAGEVSITGGSQVNITAREVALLGTAAGGTRIWAELAAGGKLKFEKLDGGANVFYRRIDPEGRALQLEPGQTFAGGVIRELAGDAAWAPPAKNFELLKEPTDTTPEAPKPAKDAFAIDGEVEKPLAGGIIEDDGGIIAGAVVSADDATVHFRRGGAEAESVAIFKVSVVLFGPFPASRKQELIRKSSGVLLRSGDFVEGTLKSIEGRRVTISSVIFGLKSFDTEKEAVALILKRPVRAEEKK